MTPDQLRTITLTAEALGYDEAMRRLAAAVSIPIQQPSYEERARELRAMGYSEDEILGVLSGDVAT